jgi:GTPase SAR1 family protein
VFALVLTGPPGAGKTSVLDALTDALSAEDVRHATVEVDVVVRLEAEPSTLRRRITDREPEGWAQLDQLVAASARLGPVIAGLDGIALALSTEGERPAAVAERIRDAWPAQLRPLRRSGILPS